MFAFCSFNTRPLWPLVVQLRNIPLRFQPIYVCNRNSGNGIRPLAAPSPFLTFSDTYARRHLKKSIWCVQRLWMGKAPNHCLNRIDRIDETTNLISGICRSCFHATLACNQTRVIIRKCDHSLLLLRRRRNYANLFPSASFSVNGSQTDTSSGPAKDEGRVPFCGRNPSRRNI